MTVLTIILGACTISYGSPYRKFDSKIPALILAQPKRVELSVTYELAIPEQVISNLPKEATVYKFVSKQISEQDFRSLSSKFGMKGQPKSDNDRPDHKGDSLLLLNEGTKRLLLNTQTGTWKYRDDSKIFQSTGANNIPSDAEVSRIATEYLKTNGWLPPDFQFQTVTAVTEELSNLSQTPKVIGKSAYFYRYIAGQPVYGVSRIIVDVGNQGEVVGVSKFYKEIEDAGKQPLKTVDQAFKEAKQKKGTVTTDNPKLKNALIKDVKIKYWEDSGSIDDQPFLQPVYAFKAEGKVNEKTEEFEVIIPAIENARIELKKVGQ
ncbi:hypothetical protein I8748_02115 [Nostoc sp. CENA67]|uniref:Uncharacterized protein n=2 Tax=Amazonocrinis TaxID=2840440 RepID=A0A8J7HK49_9NOST|nr:hypothetical protein [Amazonocrinis nigriterrae CENA67]